MTEYDAFGRKKGEDPLAGLGGESVDLPASGPAPTPAPSTQAPYAPRPAPAGRGRRRRRRGGGIVAAIIAVITVAVAGAAALAVFGMAVTEEVSTGVVETQGVPAADAPAAAEPPRGLRRGSLIRRGELTQALRTIRAAEIGGIVSLRVDPEDVSAQIKTRDGYLRHVTVTKAAGLTKGSPSGPGYNHIETFAAREVDPAAPERLVRAAARRMKRSPDEVNYLVLMDLGRPTWGLFFKDGVHFQGTMRGKIIRRTN